MPAERHADPEVTQALESVEASLHEEQSALGILPQEHAALQARLEQLQTERAQLRQELEDSRRGRPTHFPRLPEGLTAPFEVQPRTHSARLLLRDLLPALTLVGCVLLMPWDYSKGWFVAGIFLLGTLVTAGFMLVGWLRRPKWRFGETTIEMFGKDAPPLPLPYSQVLDVEAHVTPSQRKRGVGNVVVVQDGPSLIDIAVRRMTLKNVPEPERLAAWLRDRCSQPE